MSNYVNIHNDDFYEFINKKYAQYKIPAKKKTFREICFPKKYELQIPQKFLAQFINPKTPYTGVLVYHRLGSGKTCTAINIAEKFKNHRRIMIVLPAALKGNFRSELRSPCAGEKYITDHERKLLKKLNPSDPEYKEIIKRSDDKINKYYTIYSYNKFIELIKNNDISFRNTLLIIDEIQNMISVSGTYYENLHKAIQNAPKETRIVLMSATPIFDKPIEIALTMNLLIRDKQIPTGTKFISTFIDVRSTKKGPVYHVKNMDIFKDYIKGFVSYFRGAPPQAFPKSEIHFVKCEMSDIQLKFYKQINKEEKKKSQIKDYVNMEISNSFFIGTRMVSNFMFPNKKIGEKGFSSLMDDDFSTEGLKKYSPKFLKILRKIRRAEGTVFVYSNFREYGGLRTFARMLEHYKYKNYESYGVGKKRFAVWSGEEDQALREEIKTVFNKKENEDGSQIKIILGSPSVKEGVSFLRVQQVHLLEPYWNWSRMDQVIGRAIRFCSHKDVPVDKRLVKVYIYLATHPSLKMSVDQKIMKMALDKRAVNLEFEKALKEAAIDCTLFKNANVYPGEDGYLCEI